MSENRNVRVIRHFFEEALNERNLSVLGGFVSEAYVEHGSMTGQGAGLDGVREHIRPFLNAFSNTRYQLEDTVAEGNKVVARWTLTGRTRVTSWVCQRRGVV